jgi:hypothetical protein
LEVVADVTISVLSPPGYGTTLHIRLPDQAILQNAHMALASVIAEPGQPWPP